MRLLLIALLLIVNCSAHSQTTDIMMHDGLNREFIYYTPTTWSPSESLPILFVLHALTQDGHGIMDITGFNDIAEANNFIVCYPTGIAGAWNANMNVSISQADDIGFIEKVAIFMQNNFNTDSNRQYLCGMSNGAFMSYKLACESSQCFAAIASISGTMSDTVYQNCSPQFMPDILHIHGTADGVVSYFGSPTTGVSVNTFMEKWQTYHNCDPIPTQYPMPNPSLIDLSYPEGYSYNNCTNAELELIKIIGGGHQWPGILTVWGGVGTINLDFYSPQVAWDFLAGKQCSQFLGFDEAIEMNDSQEVLKIIDLMGKETMFKPNTPLIFIYSDGSRERVFRTEY